MTVAVFNRFIGSLGGVSELTAEQLMQVPEDERSEFFYNYLAGLGLQVPKRQFTATFDVATASERACRAYRPATLAQEVDVTLFRATQGFRDMPVDYGWSAFLAGGMHTCDISADHFTIVENGPITQVAHYINHAPARSSGRSSKDRPGVAA
jgi:thioesterase domain-containing protein